MSRKSSIGVLLSVIVLLAVEVSFGKIKETASSDDASVRAGTKISAELESAVDAKTAKPGDEVTAKVTHNIKQDGKVVVHKGDRLLGHVTSAKAAGSAHEGSSVNVVFDRLASGGSTTQLNAVVSTLLSSSRGPSAPEDDMPLMTGPGAAPVGGGGGGRGGLVGGATGAVGSTAGAAGSSAGSLGGTVGGAAQTTVGSAAQTTVGGAGGANLATPVKMIHIDSAVQAEGQAGTTSSLSTRQGNLRLDSGTRMELRVAAQGSAQAK